MEDILKELETTEKRLHESLKEINARPDFNATAIDVLYKVVDEIKDISTIRAMEESSNYSGYPYMRYFNGEDYGNSYGRRSYGDNYTSHRYSGTMHDRDNDGRYNEGWSRNDKHSRIRQLRDMMQNASDEREYEMYRKMIDQLEH